MSSSFQILGSNADFENPILLFETSRGTPELESITLSLETEIQFSVRVPVLSNTMTETLPDTLILETFTQLICCSLSLCRANITPTLIAIGSSGGTENENASNVENIISSIPKYLIKVGRTTPTHIKLNIAKVKIYNFNS